MNTKLLDLRAYSISYHNILSDGFVDRLSLIRDIEETASHENNVIVLEGAPGIGKTKLLMQLAKKNHLNSFSYFYNPSCKFTAKPEFFMQDIGQQIYFYLNNESAADEIINETSYNKIIFDFLRTPIKKGAPVYFILDGLDQIDQIDIEIIRSTLELLPWATNNVYFFISGATEKLQKILPVHIFKKSRVIRATRFTYGEMLQFFNWEDTHIAKDVYEMWNGNPESFSQIKRILSTGVDLDDFLLNEYSEKDDLLEKEWKISKIEINNFEADLTKLLCVLVFDDNIRSLSNISTIIGTRDSHIREKISKLTYIEVKEDDIRFVSSSLKKYVAKKLNKFEKKSIALLIDYYTKEGDLSAVIHLPGLHDRNEDWNGIISVLSPIGLETVMSNSQSFSDIKKQLNLGYKASRKLNKSYDNIFKFSLYRSLINGLQKSDIREDQLLAFIALDKKAEAFKLISKSLLREDKLRMLITYAKDCKQLSVPVEDDIVKEIEELVELVDRDYLKENIVDIAIGLAHFLPDLAVKVLDKNFGGSKSESSLEVLLNHVAFVVSNDQEKVASSRLENYTSDRAGHSLEEQFEQSISSGLLSTPEDDITQRVQGMENILDKIYLLKSWIRRNPKSKDIIKVMEYGVGLVFESSTVVKPTTTNLLSIFRPMIYFEQPGDVHEWVTRLDKILSTISYPVNDRVKLKLWAIQALVPHDIMLANSRMLELYESILKIIDISVRSECFASCWQLVDDLKKSNHVNFHDFLLQEEEVKINIESTIGVLLENSADHFDELKNTFEILPSIDLAFASSVAHRLNTYPRRSEALCKCIDIHCQREFQSWELSELLAILDDLSNGYLNEAVESIIGACFSQIEAVTDCTDIFSNLTKIIGRAYRIETRVKLIVQSLQIIGMKPKAFDGYVANYGKLTDKLLTMLRKHWSEIENPILRIRQGYLIASSLVKVNRALAESYFHDTENLAEEFAVNNDTHFAVFSDSIRLVIRIHIKLLSRGHDLPLDRLSIHIDRIASRFEQIRLWSELAVRVGLIGNRTALDSIVADKIVPAIEIFRPNYTSPYFFEYLRVSAAAIYMSQSETLKIFLRYLRPADKETVICSVCYVLLTGVYESDPYSEIKGSSSFKYQQAMGVINLLEDIDTDYVLHWHINKISNIAKNFPSNFTAEQKAEIARRLSDLSLRKLPNISSGIGHNGFLIASKASVLNFSKLTHQRPSELTLLASEAETIGNVTDRALVYLLLARECPDKARREQLLIKTVEEADKILSIREKVSIYEDALEEMSEISNVLFATHVRKIQEDILNLDETERYNTYRKLIEVTFKHDKSLAKKLVAALDSDPGRKQFHSPINDYYELLDLEKQVSEDYGKINSVKSRGHIGRIALKMLGELNAKTRFAKGLESTVPLLFASSKMPFPFSLPVFELFIENMTDSTVNNDGLLFSIYESANNSALLCFNFICHITNRTPNQLFSNFGESNSSFVVKPGMRAEGLYFIEQFLRNHGSNEILIADPYFSDSDVMTAREFVHWCGATKLSILTSVKAGGEFSQFAYLNAWRRVSSEEPPHMHIISASNHENNSPFHDRYILLMDRRVGIRVGTSINAIGGKRVSDLTLLGESDFDLIIDQIVTPLVYNRIRIWDTQSIKYQILEI